MAAAWAICTKLCSADTPVRETPKAIKSPARKSGALLLGDVGLGEFTDVSRETSCGSFCVYIYVVSLTVVETK